MVERAENEKMAGKQKVESRKQKIEKDRNERENGENGRGIETGIGNREKRRIRIRIEVKFGE